MSNKKKGLSPLDLFMIGFGAIVGVSWAVASNSWVTNAGGIIPAVLGFIIGILILVAIAFCYAEMTTAMPVAGGVVVYAYKAFGTFPSFISGWLLALAYCVMLPWESIYISDVLGIIFPVLKSGRILYTLGGYDIYLNSVIVGLLMSVVIIVINWVGTEVAAKFQTVLGVVLIFCGIVVIVAGFIKADVSNLYPIYENIGSKNHASLFGGILTMICLVPMYMSGFDTIPQGIEDAGGKVTSKVLVLVLVGSIVAGAIFYCLIIFASCIAMSWQEFGSLSSPAVAQMFKYIGYSDGVANALYWMTMIGALTGLLTTWNSFYIAASRFLMSMSRARLLPEFFGTINKYGTPAGAGIFCAIASFIGPCLGVGMIDPVTSVGSAGFMCGWGLTVFCMIRLRKTAPDMHRPFKTPGGLGMAWFAGIASLAVVIAAFATFSPGYMGSVAVTIFAVWVVIGLIMYAISAKRRSSISDEARMEVMFAKKHVAESVES